MSKIGEYFFGAETADFYKRESMLYSQFEEKESKMLTNLAKGDMLNMRLGKNMANIVSIISILYAVKERNPDYAIIGCLAGETFRYFVNKSIKTQKELMHKIKKITLEILCLRQESEEFNKNPDISDPADWWKE